MSRPPTKSWWDVACNISERPSSMFQSSDWIPLHREDMWDQLMVYKKEMRAPYLLELKPEEAFMLALFLYEAGL